METNTSVSLFLFFEESTSIYISSILHWTMENEQDILA